MHVHGDPGQKDVWYELRKYEKLLHKLSWKWTAASKHRVDREDIFQELILLYYNVRNRYIALDEAQFAKVLYTSANHRCIDLVCERHNTFLSISSQYEDAPDIEIAVDTQEFKELFSEFFLQDLESLLQGAEVARTIYTAIMDLPSELVGIIGTVRPGCVKRCWRVGKTDLCGYLGGHGLSVGKFRKGMEVLKTSVVELVRR